MDRTSGFLRWLLGRTPRQQERLQQNATRPVRTAVLFGIPYGVAMSVYLGHKDDIAGVVAGILAAVGYGWGMSVWLRRRARRFHGA